VIYVGSEGEFLSVVGDIRSRRGRCVKHHHAIGLSSETKRSGFREEIARRWEFVLKFAMRAVFARNRVRLEEKTFLGITGREWPVGEVRGT